MWKRFRPRVRGRLDDQTLYDSSSLYGRAKIIMQQALREVSSNGGSMKRSDQAANMLKRHNNHQPEELLAQLILLSASASRAQKEMDEHRGGYKNRQARLFELIDFNDTFVDTVLALPEDYLADFPARLKAEITRYCESVGVTPFSDQQFDAIIHGLSREIAVYRGARELGYIVHMTSRVQDAKGVDMVVTDPKTKKSINVDVKTHSAFHFRLIELQHQRRIDESRRLECELAGFCKLVNGHNHDQVETVLLRIATDRLGEIRNFGFENLSALGTLISQAIENDGRYIAG